MRKFNLEPNKDVSILVAGPTTDRLTAMGAGSIDATLLTPTEAVLAKKRGFGEIYDLLDMGVEIQGNGFATSRGYIKANRAAAKAAVKGYVEAIYYIHNNAEGTKAIVGKYLRTNDQEVLTAAHVTGVRGAVADTALERLRVVRHPGHAREHRREQQHRAHAPGARDQRRLPPRFRVPARRHRTARDPAAGVVVRRPRRRGRGCGHLPALEFDLPFLGDGAGSHGDEGLPEDPAEWLASIGGVVSDDDTEEE